MLIISWDLFHYLIRNIHHVNRIIDILMDKTVLDVNYLNIIILIHNNVYHVNRTHILIHNLKNVYIYKVNKNM
jgi:hypothetical protein